LAYIHTYCRYALGTVRKVWYGSKRGYWYRYLSFPAAGNQNFDWELKSLTLSCWVWIRIQAVRKNVDPKH